MRLAKNYGSPRDVYNGADVVFQYRRGRLTAGGGWNIGNSIQTGVAAGGNVSNSNESCFVVDTPQELFNCKVNNPYQSRFKLNGSYTIPWQDLQVALVYQNNPGPGYTTNITYPTRRLRRRWAGTCRSARRGRFRWPSRTPSSARAFRSSISAPPSSCGCPGAVAFS